MGLGALALIQAACNEAKIPAPTSGLITATDDHTKQLLALFYKQGRDLLNLRVWPQLKTRWMLFLQAGRKQYQLPQDYFSANPSTFWDLGNKWEMVGPLTDSELSYREYGFITLENRKGFRIWGPDSNPNSPSGQIYISPVPTSSNVATPLTFEYVSSNWLRPANWLPSTAYTAPTAYVFNGGYIYKCSTSGTSSTIGPQVCNGIGQDGGVTQVYISGSAWGGSTAYGLGDYVTNGGNWYKCIGNGTSASSGGPTTTSTSITDGTCIWTYVLIPAWAAETAIGAGTYSLANSKVYLASTLSAPNSIGITTAITGKVAPNFDGTIEVDGTARWTWQPTYSAILADTDTCAFDDNLMIAGLVWRFLRARGLTFEDQLEEYNQILETALNRWNPGRKISLANDGYMLAGLHPRISEGNFG